MRSKMTQKLCPLLSLFFAVVGCGKKATDAETKTAPIVDQQVPDSNIVMELDTSKSRSSVFKIERTGTYTLPELLKIRSGSLPGRKITMTFEQSPNDPGIFSIQCTYVTSASQADIMEVETCYDSDGKDIGNYTTEILPMHANYLVRMELQGSLSPATIFAFFTVE